QPALHRTLRLLFGRDDRVTIVPSAVRRAPGTGQMHINPANPTISTLSEEFIAASRRAASWQGETWPRALGGPVTAPDALIAARGSPLFGKLDMEGLQAVALAGRSKAVPARSFEFTTIQRDVALACLERCTALGYAEFNAALGESQRLGEWRSAEAIADW